MALENPSVNFTFICDGGVSTAQLQHQSADGTWTDVGDELFDVESPLEVEYQFVDDDQTGDNYFRMKFKADPDLDEITYSPITKVELTEVAEFDIRVTSDAERLDLSSEAKTLTLTATSINPKALQQIQWQRNTDGTWSNIDNMPRMISMNSVEAMNGKYTLAETIPLSARPTTGEATRYYRLQYKRDMRIEDTFSKTNTVPLVLFTVPQFSSSDASVNINAENKTVTFTMTFAGTFASIQPQRKAVGETEFTNFGSAVTNQSRRYAFTDTYVTGTGSTSNSDGNYEYRIAYVQVAGGTTKYTDTVTVNVFRLSEFFTIPSSSNGVCLNNSGNLFVSAGSYIYEYTTAGVRTTKSRFQAAGLARSGDAIRGMAKASSGFYGITTVSKRIYRFNDNGGNATPGGTALGLTWNVDDITVSSNTIYAAYDSDGTIYAYSLADRPSRQSARDITTTGSRTLAVAMKGDILYYISAGVSTIYAHNVSTNRDDSAKRVSLHADNGNARSMEIVGSTAYVVDQQDSRIYTYTVT